MKTFNIWFNARPKGSTAKTYDMALTVSAYSLALAVKALTENYEQIKVKKVSEHSLAGSKEYFSEPIFNLLPMVAGDDVAD